MEIHTKTNCYNSIWSNWPVFFKCWPINLCASLKSHVIVSRIEQKQNKEAECEREEKKSVEICGG